MAKNLVLGPVLAQIWAQRFFWWILPVLDVRHCCKVSLYAISRKTNEPSLRKWQKTQFWAQFWLKFGPPNFFCGFYLCQYLGIVPGYNLMQFQGKLLNQLEKMATKPSFRLDFGTFGSNLGLKIFFRGFYLYQMLDIAASYHRMQFQGKLLNQT